MFPHTEFLCEEGTWWTLLFTVAGMGHCGEWGWEEGGKEREREREEWKVERKGKRGEMINTRPQVHNSAV